MDVKAGLPGAIRVGAVALLLAVGVTGLRARGALSATPGTALAAAGGHAATVVVTAAAGAGLAGCAVLVILLRRPRRRRAGDDDFEPVPTRPPAPWWASTLGLAVSLAVLGGVVLVAAHAGYLNPAATRATASPGTPRAGTGHTLPPGTAWPALAGILLAIAALAALAVIARRGARSHGSLAASAPAPGDAAALAAGVRAGSAALHAADGPRQAIIDCYAAMERGLAAAGAPPAAADTPGEVLARAAASALVRGTAARDLTGVFRRARYSRQPVTEADRAAAADALARLRSDLGSLRP